MIRTFLFAVILLFCLSFALANREETVTLRYYFGWRSDPLPVAYLVLGSLAGGFCVAAFLAVPAWLKMKIEIRRKTRTIQRMEEDLERLSTVVRKAEPPQ